MNPGAVYVRTEKGAEEVAHRSHAVPAKARSLLLLIDGKLTGAQLLDKFAAFPNSAELLQVLEDGGLIAAQAGAPVPAAAASPSGSATVSAPAAVAQPGIAEAKRVIVRTLHDVLGPEADFLTEKIDVAQTAAVTGGNDQGVQGPRLSKRKRRRDCPAPLQLRNAASLIRRRAGLR